MANKQFHVGKEKLGQGAVGYVCRGRLHQNGEDVDVAIKRVINDGDILEDLKRECDFLQAVQDHTNIIKFLGLEYDENFIYIITELGDCGDLDQILNCF